MKESNDKMEGRGYIYVVVQFRDRQWLIAKSQKDKRETGNGGGTKQMFRQVHMSWHFCPRVQSGISGKKKLNQNVTLQFVLRHLNAPSLHIQASGPTCL